MDISMVIGLALAGAIMLLNGNKSQAKKPKPNNSEFVVSVGGDGGVSISPKKKTS